MLNFPDAPTPGQVFSSGALAWAWDGVKWAVPPGGATVVGSTDITVSTALPRGANGTINIRNGMGSVLTVTLPTLPTPGQTLWLKDAAGNAGVHPIIIASADLIDGNATYTLVSNYASLEVYWTGTQWGTR